MKKLIEQILKFGVVGVVCFGIDFVITLAVAALLRGAGMETKPAALIGAFWGFTISVIVNYILSMKFVFVRREDMDRKREFVIFVILSLIGLGLNELIIKLAIDVAYEGVAWIRDNLSAGLVTAGAKIVATGIVMVYNFITRKIFLEEKNTATEDSHE
ncbi:MAG: GtrA family protein [Lachnospiraceae bacterium]|nr:GtrA family protein [Lachnospiraceae bacterium]